MNPTDHDLIIAPATAPGGALAVVRLSGEGAIACCDRLFRGRRPLAGAATHTAHYGEIVDGQRVIDDVVATLFRAPHSYTGEESVELSCHGSPYVVSEILRLAMAAGARMASPGEFTVRAYLAGRLDLSQAEAVADLIASSSRAAHTLATTQLRGGYSSRLEELRGELLRLVSLLELELDFSEEEVEFADRTELRALMERIDGEIARLRNSFSLGNAIREGIPVAIVGAPNAGKSTLLNRLLGDERALVSEIAGTTRDVIEEPLTVDGIPFRLLDTAGIRTTEDPLERMGIERTRACVARARIVIRLLDATTLGGSTPDDTTTDGTTAGGTTTGSTTTDGTATDGATTDGTTAGGTTAGGTATDGATAGRPDMESAHTMSNVTSRHQHVAPSPVPDTDTIRIHAPDFKLREDQLLLDAVNKCDLVPGLRLPEGILSLSARSGEGIDGLLARLRTSVETSALYHGDPIVSTGRHFEALTQASEALHAALAGLADGLPADLLSEELRAVIRAVGSITGRGTITPDEVLANIFSKFCIGK